MTDKENGSWFVPEPGNGNNNTDAPEGNGMPVSAPAANALLVHSSMVLGVIALASAVLSTVYLPFIFGSLAIVIAILSRKEDGLLELKSKLGILLGSFAIVLNIIMVSTAVYSVFHNPEQYKAFDEMFTRVYGESFSEFTEELHNSSEYF